MVVGVAELYDSDEGRVLQEGSRGTGDSWITTHVDCANCSARANA